MDFDYTFVLETVETKNQNGVKSKKSTTRLIKVEELSFFCPGNYFQISKCLVSETVAPVCLVN